MSDTLQTKYEILCRIPSDINEHLPTLYDLASKYSHVTEFGVRHAVSTTALLAGLESRKDHSKLISYDINRQPQVAELEQLTDKVEFIFHQENTLEVEIASTDLLFIDTLHNYEQLKQELKQSTNVKSQIVLHDTTTFGINGETSEVGLTRAITEFLENSRWRLAHYYPNNNGLTILERS